MSDKKEENFPSVWRCYFGSGGMVPLIRTLAALEEDLHSVPA